MDRAGCTEVPCEKGLGLSCVGGRFFPLEFTASAKTQRQEHAWCVPRREMEASGEDNVSKTGMRRQDERGKRGMGHMAWHLAGFWLLL